MKNLKITKNRNFAFSFAFPKCLKNNIIEKFKQTILFSLLIICSTIAITQNSYGQTWEEAVMDSVLKIFPPESMYVKNEVIIKFKPNALNLSILCYDYTLGSTLTTSSQQRQPNQIGLNDTLRSYLENQVFSVDDLIVDNSLRLRMKLYGGDSLRRISLANPCVDTLSVTRQGDTIDSDFYLFLLLKLNNDSSVVPTCVWLTTFHQSELQYVVPNTINIPAIKTPNDHYYSSQTFLTEDYIGANSAWDFEVGDKNTLVGIFDTDLVDPYHCDLNNGPVDRNKKLVERRGVQLYYTSHSTSSAGIIGAHTNREACATFEGGVTGIAGGYGQLGFPQEPEDLGNGASLLSYNVRHGDGVVKYLDEACSFSPNSPHGAGIHIGNFSYMSLAARGTLLGVEEALDKAFNNGVALVASRGNIGQFNNISVNAKDYILPASFDAHKITSVGASDKILNNERLKTSYSCYARNLDVLAPSPECNSNPDENIIKTTHHSDYNYINGVFVSTPRWGCFDGTSAAAPQVTGAYALLHSWSMKNDVKLYPEDYEGMIKASAKDMYSDNNPNYDEFSGWGQLDLKNLFFMLQLGYRIFHYELENFNDFTYPNFPSTTHNVNVSNLGDTSGSVSDKSNWNVYMRPVTYEVTHNCQWVDFGGYEVYVWGRSGKLNGKHGFGPTNPPESQEFGFAGTSTLFQNGYTGVLSGIGGNNLVSNMIHTGSYVTKSHKFNLVTYQYKFRNIWGDFTRPLRENMGMQYTVFAKSCGDDPCCPDPPTNILEQDPLFKLKLMPSITNSQIELASDMLPRKNSILTISNSIGEIMFIKDKFYSNRYMLKTSLYPNGIYYVKIQNGDFTSTESFIIQR